MKKFTSLLLSLLFFITISPNNVYAYDNSSADMERVTLIFNSEEEKNTYIASNERDVNTLYTYVVLTGRPLMRYVICNACGDSYMYTATIEEELRSTVVSCPHYANCPDTMVESRKFTANTCISCNYYSETGILGYRYKVACAQDSVINIKDYFYIVPTGAENGEDIHCWTSSYPSYTFKRPILTWSASEMV